MEALCTMNWSEGAVEKAPTSSFEALPSALHLHVLSFLPLVERVRSTLVARSWAVLLADHAFWAELRFDGVAEGVLDRETLLQLYRRAGGCLKALDVSDPACGDLNFAGFFEALASESLGSTLQTLRAWAPDQDCGGELDTGSSAENAAALLAACPALTSAAVAVCGTPEDALAALRALPGPGGKRVNLVTSATDIPPVTCSALAEFVSAALAASSVEELCLHCSELDTTFASAGADRAAAKLAAALAAPDRGIRSLHLNHSGVGDTPLLSSLCVALTAESPLTGLHLQSCGVAGAGAAEIAFALAPGRSRLRTLKLSENDLSGDGGVALLASLGSNETLTKLDLRSAALGGVEAAAALATSLRSNATLQSLDISFANFSPGGGTLILGALASSSGDSPSRCGLVSLTLNRTPLDLPACEALGASLACGATTLEELSVVGCSIELEGVGAIAKGLLAGKTAARLRSLDLSGNFIGLRGAEALGQALADPTCPLETLSLGSTGLIDEEVVALARGLEGAGTASRLRSLRLSANGLGDAEAEALGRVLAAQGPGGALRHLNVSCNDIGPGGAARIAEGLRVNSSLEVLDLSDNGIGPGGAAAIAAALSGAGGVGSGLRSLLLVSNGLTSAGVAAMLDAGLGRSASLTKLYMCENGLEDAGCLALAHWAAGLFGAAPPDDGMTAAAGGSAASNGAAPGGGARRPPASDSAPPTLPPLAEHSPQQSVDRRFGRRSLTVFASGNYHSGEGALSIKRIVERANASAAAAAAAASIGRAPWWGRAVPRLTMTVGGDDSDSGDSGDDSGGTDDSGSGDDTNDEL